MLRKFQAFRSIY